MDFSKLIFLLVFTVLFQSVAISQDWISYQSHGQINDLVDNGDELLLATDQGLVVVDKTTLEKTFFDKSNSNLSSNHIQSITMAADGSAWIGTYDVIMARFDGSDFEDPIIPSDPAINQNTHLYDFKIAPNGDFWVGLSNGVIHREGQDWTFYAADEIGSTFFEAWDIAISEDGEVFVASIDLHQFENGTWNNLTENTAIENYNSSDLFFNSTGDLYMAGDLEKIARYDGNEWETFDIDFNGSEILKFTEDTDGGIYFNSWRDGVFKLVNGEFINQSDAQTAIFDNRNNYFYIDDQDNRWLNTNIHLSVNDNGAIQSTLISTNTLETNSIQTAHKGANGNMYFLTVLKNNISVVDADGNWSFLPLPTLGTPFEFLYDVFAIADNDIWLASQVGLYHYDGTDWTYEELEPCRSFAKDSEGKIYVRSDNRIYVLDNGNISEINTSNSSLSMLPITAHGIDNDDNLWIGTGDFSEQNVIQQRTTDGTWTTYSADDHPAIERITGDFRFGNNGEVWVPNDAFGVIRFDGTTFTNPFTGNVDQVENYRVQSVEIDGQGMLYFSHEYGVTTWDDGEWGDLVIEDVSQGTSSKAVIQFDDAGTLWWASNSQGVFSYSAETTSTESLPQIETISNYTIYPNPASHFTTVEFTLQETKGAGIIIYNQLGQMISTMDLGKLTSGHFHQRIDLSQFPKGIYNVQLRTGERTATKVVIVQ
ncbi:MAG: T9SS type A sorting domain-containing protein [Saprospiraceae bacterium]